MKTANAIKTLQSLENFSDEGHKISAQIKGFVIEAGIYNREDEGGFVGSVLVRRHDDVSDIRSDYFAGTFFPNIKRALAYASR